MTKRRKLTAEERAECSSLKKLWNQRKKEMREKGIKFTQELAIEKLGFESQGAISHYLNAKIALNTDAILKFANFLNCDAALIRPSINILFDSRKIQHSISDAKKGVYNTEKGPNITGRVPLINWVQAGDWAEIIENHLPGDAEEWRLTTARCSKNTFALRVKGDSMTNPYSAPSIPEGYIIIVDPNQQPENGDLVIARLDDSMEATFKKLVIDGPKKYLKPLNPAYPVIEINGNCTMVGKIMKVEWEP